MYTTHPLAAWHEPACHRIERRWTCRPDHPIPSFVIPSYTRRDRMMYSRLPPLYLQVAPLLRDLLSNVEMCPRTHALLIAFLPAHHTHGTRLRIRRRRERALQNPAATWILEGLSALSRLTRGRYLWVSPAYWLRGRRVTPSGRSWAAETASVREVATPRCRAALSLSFFPPFQTLPTLLTSLPAPASSC